MAGLLLDGVSPSLELHRIVICSDCLVSGLKGFEGTGNYFCALDPMAFRFARRRTSQTKLARSGWF